MVRFSTFLRLILVMIVSIFACECTMDGSDDSVKKNGDKSVQAIGETVDIGIVEILKNRKLANYPSVTIGNAFDSYKFLVKKEWKLETRKSGQFTVEFTGLLEPNTLNDNDRKDGVTSKGIIVTFIIEPNGSFYVFMVSKIESRSDGNVYRNQVNDIAGILADIYANRKLSF